MPQINRYLMRLLRPLLGSAFGTDTAMVLGTVILSFLVFAESLVCVFWIFALSSLGEGYAFMAAVPYVYIIISYSSLLIFYRLKRFDSFTFTQLVMLLVMPFFMQWVIGGFQASSGVAFWAILSPVGALMILGTKQSTPWFLLFTVLAAISWYLNAVFAGHALPIPEALKNSFFVINMAGVATILYIAMRYFQSQKSKVMEALALEQARSERLLRSILPGSVADRLRGSNERIADSHEAVTILFADLVDFTRISADLPPAEVVDLLNMVFSRFDQLAEKYGVEKIKTIGDAYMVVAGAPDARVDHAHIIAEMALEVPSVIAELSTQAGRPFAMRIGINSGPVVAGIIGNTRFSYDLWGDAVNVASRMEHTGLPNEIQVSAASYQLLKDDYVFEPRGLVEIKGKGSVETYWLKAKRTMRSSNSNEIEDEVC
ncbi:adenylate/guanylate cyclase domain-containing protein [Methylobacillus gramineus]|uniref:adenylate/guanylate cyclase domain-containing protein n=1 Tax=Methylobacillus gramineus TaxID=755169 RepID=UPI001D000899|nr:adenylate/guanylate cyclase domain-containing protein [Methylobacillus gramineus]MCB5184196.1 adenylate/guanylate cyclase domain-containing protein [Methylobacillus gramineus]